MSINRLKWASLITGLGLAVWAVISLSDPAYYDPQEPIDYVASILAQVLFLSIAYTYYVWWRVTPVRRSAALILVAGGGFVLWAVGNLLEEVIRADVGEYIYFVGAGGAILISALAGVVTLTAPHRWRWTGLVLLGVFATLLLEDLPLLTPVPWLAFSYSLHAGLLGTLESQVTPLVAG